MGYRANFVIVREDEWHLYFSRSMAKHIGSLLAAGPEVATRTVAGLIEVPDRNTDWLDDDWAEGGAVIDLVHHALTFYGDTGDRLPIPQRRLLLQLLRWRWPRWRVEWAYDGIGDLAAAVNVDRSVVRSANPDGRRMPTEVVPPTEPCHLLTVRHADGRLAAYPVDNWCHTGWQGPSLLDRLPPGGVDRLALADLPESGLHVDVPERTVSLWLGYTGDGLLPAMPQLWPGWQVRFWADRYERQLVECDGLVSVPPVDPMAALTELVEDIGADHKPDSWLDDEEWASFTRLADQLRAQLRRPHLAPDTPAWLRIARPAPDIAEFVAARLAEREASVAAAARIWAYEQRCRRQFAPPYDPQADAVPVHESAHREAPTGVWRAGLFALQYRSLIEPADPAFDRDQESAARHMEHHSPARVSDDLRAKRRILDRYSHARAELDKLDGASVEVVAAARERFHQLLLVLREIAGGYRYHPDYNPDWAFD